jgi:hypothetical protein
MVEVVIVAHILVERSKMQPSFSLHFQRILPAHGSAGSVVVVVAVVVLVVVRQSPHNIGHCFITSWPYSGLVQSSSLTSAHSAAPLPSPSQNSTVWVVVGVVVGEVVTVVKEQSVPPL